MEIENLKFDENGLIPAIIQDAETRTVLMLGYMNREALTLTPDEWKSLFFLAGPGKSCGQKVKKADIFYT